MAGKVYLVGAGPGDPGLITVRGRDLLERADVVVYDSLVNELLLDHAPRAEHVFVGKRTGQHALAQEDINRILIDYGRTVDCVVRLKGGDPLLFGRGGEEALALSEAGVAFEIVPGVTAGVAAPAAAGIPVTHRGMAASVTFLTGHLESEGGGLALDKLHLEGTLAVYMGVATMGRMTERLMELGRARETPAAVVQWGTLGRQRTVTGTLETIAEKSAAAGIEAPAIVVIGEVVSFREVLAWFEDRPLYGRRVAVTRTRQGAGALIRQLLDLGADVFEFPTIEIDAKEAPEEAIDFTAFDWVMLASVNAVEALFDRLNRQGLDARDLHGVRFCAVGTTTAEALESRYLRIDANPGRYDNEGVLTALQEAGGALEGRRVLIPRADVARSTLSAALREAGAVVTELEAYRTAVPRDTEALADALVAFQPDYVTFTSGAAAHNFARVVGAGRLREIAGRAVFAAIGPIAGEAAREGGIAVKIQPGKHTVVHLIDAIVEYDRQRREQG